ncbi:MAG: hypothetical protein ACM3U2_18765, partial [Deltaproteobacteria bacterium]
TMFLNDPLSTPRPAGGRPALVAIALSTTLVVAFGILPRPVFNFLQRVPAGPSAVSTADVAPR